MNDVSEKHVSSWKTMWFVLYFSIGNLILKSILTDGFSVPRNIAYTVSVLFLGLSGYFLFIRGTENRWTKDKRPWTFFPWAIITAVLAVMTFIFFSYV